MRWMLLSWLILLGCQAERGRPTEGCRCAGDIGGARVDVACGETFCAGGERYECSDSGVGTPLGVTCTDPPPGFDSGTGGGSLCTDTCAYPGDGECDDGGDGSITSLCEYGTDCTDCGSRTGSPPPPPMGCSSTDPPYCDGNTAVSCSGGVLRRVTCSSGCAAGACDDPPSSFRVTVSYGSATPSFIDGGGGRILVSLGLSGVPTITPDPGETFSATDTNAVVVSPSPGTCRTGHLWFIRTGDSSTGVSFSLVDEPGETACSAFANAAARDGVELRITGQDVVLGGARRPVDIDLIARP